MKVRDFLTEHNVPFETVEHMPTFDAQRMAQSVHAPGREVAKTVLLKADGGFKYIVAILPATHHVDLQKVSVALGDAQVELANEHEIAQHCPDCEVGALPPFGTQYGMTTLVDESLVADDEIVFEGNTHSEAIRMKFKDFRHLEEPLVCSFAYEG